MVYDVLIVGAGGAGLSAAIYTTRYDLKTLILTKDIGGQAALTDNIENYPGILSINGFDLMLKFKEHAEKFGTEIKTDTVTEIIPDEKIFKVQTKNNTYQAKTVIVATGLEHRKLGVPGEDKFYGKGVAYCATCDAPLFKNKRTAIIGGGNSALGGAEILGRIGTKTYGIVRNETYFGEQVLLDKVLNNPKIEKIYNAETVEIKGDQTVQSIIIQDRTTKKTTELEVDGVFVSIGWKTETEWLSKLVARNKIGEILISQSGQTSTPGLFAAGDVTKLPTKQLVVSAAEGVKAGLAAVDYLRST